VGPPRYETEAASGSAGGMAAYRQTFQQAVLPLLADSGPLSPHVPGQLDLLFNEHVDFMKVVPPSDLY
jgi:hypothetical protein